MSRKYGKYGGILYIWVEVNNTENNFEAYMQSFKNYHYFGIYEDRIC